MRRAVWIGGALVVASVVVLQAVASYPTSTKSFSTRVDGQTIVAAWFNEIQDEVVAIENGLRTGLAHDLLPDGDVTRALGSSSFRWLLPNGTAAAPGIAIRTTDNGMYSSGTDAIEFATNGTKALGIDSTQFIDSPTQPRASAYNNATQSINDVTTTALTFNSEDFDVATMHDTGSNTSRVTVPTGGDGLYWIRGGTSWAANATGFRQAFLMKNGTTDLWTVTAVNAGAATIVSQEITFVAVLVAGDYIELRGRQNSGGALAAGSASRELGSHLQMVKVW